jgi:isopentenyl-diphosphate delta-isomerase
MHCSFLIGPLIQSTMSEARPELQGYDQEQIEMMEEACILVDEEDNILGKDTKVNCHLGEGKLHRAFSVLLFNSSGKLLIQKRASGKITFPSIWANSCCSHPLHIDSEVNGIEGAKTAAKRKMEQELGIEPDEIKLEQLNYVTKMVYKARANKKWVEHEIDYIFALKCDLDINPNKIEIEETKYVNLEELESLFDDKKAKIGPWFRLIKENFLNDIWKALDNLGEIGDNKIHYMGNCE